MNAQGEWSGKDQIHSTEDFKEKQEIQEKMIKDYMSLLNRYNISYHNYDKIGEQLQGVAGDLNQEFWLRLIDEEQKKWQTI